MMKWKLRHDEPTGELRVAATDFWDGHHERSEWRVIREDGSPIKRRPDLDGRAVQSDAPGAGFYVEGPSNGLIGGHRDYIKLEDAQVVSESIPCRRAWNRRLKCDLCLAFDAERR